MDTPNEAAQYVPTCLTAPLRFRIPKDDYKLLQEYAAQNGYSLGNLSRAIIKSFVRSKIVRPRIDDIIE